MTFGKYLKECIDKRDISTSYLTKVSNINRGKLYYVYDGKRKLTDDELFSLMDKAGFSSVEVDKLINLYFNEYYGDVEFSRIKFLENAIQKDNYVGDNVSYEISENINGQIQNKEQLLNAIAYVIYNDCNIISNFSFRDKEIDNVVFDCILNSNNNTFTHIMELNPDELGEENLERIFASLKYMYNGCFPVYRYYDVKNMEVFSMFPYYLVGEKYAVLYNSENGVLIDNADAVNGIKNNVEKIKEKCTELGTKPEDIMFVKSLYEKGSKSENTDTINITYYPCIAKYVDYDFMYSVTKDEIPEKEMLVNVAYEHYTKFYSEQNFSQITTSKGLELFVQTGYFQEIPGAYVNAATKSQRIKVLKSLITAVENDELFIFDDDKINMFPGFEIENHNHKIIIDGYDIKKGNFASTDNYIVSFDDQSITSTFDNFKEYIILSRKVYSKQYSKKFIESLVVKLEHTNTD